MRVGATVTWWPLHAGPLPTQKRPTTAVCSPDGASPLQCRVGRSSMLRWVAHGSAQALMVTARKQSIYKLTDAERYGLSSLSSAQIEGRPEGCSLLVPSYAYSAMCCFGSQHLTIISCCSCCTLTFLAPFAPL